VCLEPDPKDAPPTPVEFGRGGGRKDATGSNNRAIQLFHKMGGGGVPREKKDAADKNKLFREEGHQECHKEGWSNQ
jgi:hypothetical protein